MKNSFSVISNCTEIEYIFLRGGYKVIPKSFEFWCGRTNRLHDRLRFRRPSPGEILDEKLTFNGEDGWVYEYLSP